MWLTIEYFLSNYTNIIQLIGELGVLGVLVSCYFNYKKQQINKLRDSIIMSLRDAGCGGKGFDIEIKDIKECTSYPILIEYKKKHRLHF
jgi:hypothetical protein